MNEKGAVLVALEGKDTEINFFQYPRIPQLTQGGLSRFYLYGVPPGDFLTTVIKGDIRSILRADDNNKRAFADIIGFMVNEVPATWWGQEDSIKIVLAFHKEQKDSLAGITPQEAKDA